MAFCPSCGAPVEGKFCAKCGTALPGDSPTATPPPPSASGLSPTIAATLAYIPIFIPAILFLVWAPYSRDKNVRFHAWQSLLLQIAWVIVAIVLSVVISIISWQLWVLLSRILNLAVLLVAAFLMWKTYNNEKVVLPVIGEMAQKQA